MAKKGRGVLGRAMKIAVEGCCHGELDKIYETLDYLEKKNKIQIDLLLICGDFQAVRNKSDLQCMAVPQKYQRMNTFYKYYSGEKKAPYLTVFIGGNHEASNYMQELPYGGWVAPNIYYMGYAGVINVGGIRIGGLSGIYKGRDLHKGHFEHPPYNNDTVRSAYHVRELEVFRLKQLSRHLDIFLSHDWPQGIYNYGNISELLKAKRFLQEEVEANKLGSPSAAELLYKLQPDYWFSAHLHVKFAAMVEHKSDESESKITKFLSLDKCLPRRKFLQVLDIPHDPEKPREIHLDPEWLSILKSTNHLLSVSRCPSFMPGPGGNDRWDFTVTQEEMNSVLEDFGGDVSLPENFEMTVPVFDPSASAKKHVTPPETCINPQTTLLCTMLEITDPNAVFLGKDKTHKYNIGEEEGEKSGALNSDDDVDDDDTEYESEPSFIMSGSEQSFSFLSTSNAEESFSSLGNPDEISIDDDDDINNDIQNLSADASETSVSDEDVELKAIMEAQRKEQKLENATDTSKSSLSQSDIDDTDSEFQEILDAQRKNQEISKTGQMEIALPVSEEDELQDILAAQKKEVDVVIDHVKESELILRPITHSSPASSDERSDSEVTKGTQGLVLSSEKYSQKRPDGSESDESPQSKRFKRRNQQLYDTAEDNTS